MKKSKMKKSDVMQYLREYNEQEIFYQKYQQKKQDKKALEEFLQEYDKNDLKHKKIYIEEFLSQKHKEFEQEDIMWLGEKKDIDVRKYSRFMPHLPAIHDFFEIIYVLEYKMFLEIEDKRICLQAGDIVFIPPNTIHKPVILEDTIAIQIMIRKSTFQKVFFKMLKGTDIISAYFLNALYGKENQNVLIFHSCLDNDILDSILQLYQENYNQLPGYRLIINNLFEVLLCFLLRLNSKHLKVYNVQQSNDERAIQMLQYIQQHCEHVTIKEMVEVFNFSKAYLSKYITRHLGKSFSEILQEIRLEKACEMLNSSHVQVEDIALAVGYKNVEHFIRLFKRKYHQTPHQYRLKNK